MWAVVLVYEYTPALAHREQCLALMYKALAARIRNIVHAAQRSAAQIIKIIHAPLLFAIAMRR
jgi:predicted ATPase